MTHAFEPNTYTHTHTLTHRRINTCTACTAQHLDTYMHTQHTYSTQTYVHTCTYTKLVIFNEDTIE